MGIEEEKRLNGTKTKYLEFRLIGGTEKTTLWNILGSNRTIILGSIRWYSHWRQYCFFPEIETIWNKDCLESIYSFLGKLKQKRELLRNLTENGN